MIATLMLAGPLAEATRWSETGWFLVRLTCVVALGHLIIAALGGASASKRHLVAVVTLAAAVILPVAVVLLPAWRLAILPPVAPPVPTTLATPVAPAVATTFTVTTPPRPEQLVQRVGRTQPIKYTQRQGDRTRPPARVAAVARLGARLDGATLVVTSTAPAPRVSVAPVPPRTPIAWPTVLALAALGGTALMLLRIVLSMARAGWIARRADPVEDRVSLDQLERARERIAVRSRVRLAMSGHVSVPIVTGLARPVLLLPRVARKWSAGRLWIVCLHELAHVRRGDAAALLLGRIATAIFWFHPLVWALARIARRESEQACDDLVLATGVRASVYADQLLRIGAMERGRDPLAAATLAVARRSSLEARLVAILSQDARRGPASRWAVAAAVLSAVCLLVPIVSVRVVAAPTPASGRPSPTERTTVTTTHTTESTRTGFAYAYSTSAKAAETSSCATACAEAQAACAEAQATCDAKACTEAQATSCAVAQATAAAKASRATADAVFAGYKSGDGLYSQARDQYEAKHYGEAGETYRQAALAGYRPATAFYNAACSYALDGQRDLALSALAEARDAGFDDAPLLTSDSDLNSIRADRRFHLIDMAIRHTDKAEAERRASESQYRALETAGSQDAGAWKSLGMTLMRSGNPELAADAFARQYKIDSSPSALYNQACAQALNRDRAQALASLERAIQVGFGDDRQVSEDADLASLHDDPRFGALVQLTRDLTLYRNGIDDDDPETWRAALPRFERVAREHDQEGRAWFNLGFAQLKTKDVTGSRQSFTRALDLHYRPPTTMYNLACVAAQAKDPDTAMDWLKKAEDAGMELQNSIFNDKDLDPLRTNPSFKALLDRTRARMAEKKHATKE